MLHAISRSYSRTSVNHGIRSRIKEMWKEGEEDRRKEFQTWAEFENRGFKPPEYMTSWIIEQYGPPEKVLQKDLINVRYEKHRGRDAREVRLRQAVKNPNDILVKVHAASINPIDVKMCHGYGKRLLDFRRNVMFDAIRQVVSGFAEETNEFPLVLGRDFSGTVVDIGSGVFDIVPGDEIFGVQQLHRQGTLADYANVHLGNVCHKPSSLSHVEAAALPYVSLTTASALTPFLKNPMGKRVLVLGGSGGIGTYSIQLLKAHGVNVTVTCGEQGRSLCSDLGADLCYDYADSTWKEAIMNDAKFDLVFDIFGTTSPEWAVGVLNRNGTYATLHTPLVRNVEYFGLMVGLSSTASDYLHAKMNRLGINIQWGFFKPDRGKLMDVVKMVDSGVVKPVIQSILDFDSVPKGFTAVADGHVKGKVVVNVSGLPEATKKSKTEKIIHL